MCGSWFEAVRGGGQGLWCSDRCRFWGRVFVRGVDECWEWQAATSGKGYGKMCTDYRYDATHRIAYRAFHGNIPNDLIVMHKCDNRLCVNPSHLFTGTVKDNADDMMRKGRGRNGFGPTQYAQPKEPKPPATHCRKGHLLDGNSYVSAKGWTVCRICRNATERRKYHRKAAKARFHVES
jgi:hypothetical protein